MIWNPETPQADILRAILAEVEARWGDPPSAGVQAMAAATAGALWRIAQAPLDPLAAEPDFLSTVEDARGRPA